MQAITIQTLRAHPVALPYVERFRTSFGEEPFKTAILIELVTSAGVHGWGEVSAELHPGYSNETMGTAAHVVSEFLFPLLIGKTIADPTEVPAALAPVRGHRMAKHGVEAAVWDAFARANAIPLTTLFESYLRDLPGAQQSRGHAIVGVSIGIHPTIDETIAIIDKRLAQGYGRIKLKIKPGWDVELARRVRDRHPDVRLMLDANSAYTLADADHLAQLDDLDLLMLEQPLAYDDIYEHSQLQPRLRTPICLDESILNVGDARMALELGACRIINLKPARVGGFSESLAIYRLCVARGVPLWIGGMLETGVGRAANLALASLPGVTLPCDISATDRYFAEDIADPAFTLQADSRIAVALGSGSGVEVVGARLAQATARWQAHNPYRHTAAILVNEVNA